MIPKYRARAALYSSHSLTTVSLLVRCSVTMSLLSLRVILPSCVAIEQIIFRVKCDLGEVW